jgi:hypothetical protein
MKRNLVDFMSGKPQAYSRFPLDSHAVLPEDRSSEKQGSNCPHGCMHSGMHWLILLLYINLTVLLSFWNTFDTGYRNPGAMVKGCSKKSCCTSKCYLDEHGIHHCVHEHDDSCDCEMMSDKGKSPATSLYRDLVLPKADAANPSFMVSFCFMKSPRIFPDRYLSIRKPPPRLHLAWFESNI